VYGYTILRIWFRVVWRVWEFVLERGFRIWFRVVWRVWEFVLERGFRIWL